MDVYVLAMIILSSTFLIQSKNLYSDTRTDEEQENNQKNAVISFVDDVIYDDQARILNKTDSRINASTRKLTIAKFNRNNNDKRVAGYYEVAHRTLKLILYGFLSILCVMVLVTIIIFSFVLYKPCKNDQNTCSSLKFIPTTAITDF